MTLLVRLGTLVGDLVFNQVTMVLLMALLVAWLTREHGLEYSVDFLKTFFN